MIDENDVIHDRVIRQRAHVLWERIFFPTTFSALLIVFIFAHFSRSNVVETTVRRKLVSAIFGTFVTRIAPIMRSKPAGPAHVDNTMLVFYSFVFFLTPLSSAVTVRLKSVHRLSTTTTVRRM